MTTSAARSAQAAAAGAVAIALVVVLAFTAPAWSASARGGDVTPTPTPTTTDTPTPSPVDDRLLPDLVALPAWDLSVQIRSKLRLLRFTSALGNIGAGPLEVRPNQNRPCPTGQHNATQIIYRDGNGNGRFNPRVDTALARHRAGCMVFHPFHHHWHFKASARYTLLDPAHDDLVVVSARRKVSFCLRDSARLPRRLGTWTYPVTYGSCGRTTPQGISVGWMDVYQSSLAGQSLRLPWGLDDGVYCLRTVVDPIDQLVESDNENNTSMRELVLKGNRVTPRPLNTCK